MHAAKAIVAQVEPALKPIAEENLTLANEHRDVTTKLRDVEHRHETTVPRCPSCRKSSIRPKMVDDVELTDTIGLSTRPAACQTVDRRILRANLYRRNDAVVKRECGNSSWHPIARH